MVFIINMRVFKTVFTVTLTLSSIVSAGPASFLRVEHRTSDDDGPSLAMDTPNSSETPAILKEDTYDQRQNGTENYRIHVDGLVLVVAPVEGLLLAGGINNDLFSGLGSTSQEKPEPRPDPSEFSTLKPIEDKPSNEQKPETSIKKSMYKPKLRLINLLAPFLRKIAPQ
ncbi:uncharacterized protein [Chelonus insularis]|uniref:uncharacterized protein n=1 Tax=Chelonus insularis TaxID=460826 RepID=UPI0015886EC0|nr:uncharacterized protein LOC118066203 [Chelonus insularis]